MVHQRTLNGFEGHCYDKHDIMNFHTIVGIIKQCGLGSLFYLPRHVNVARYVSPAYTCHVIVSLYFLSIDDLGICLG